MKMPNSQIRQFLDLSIAHLSHETRDRLDLAAIGEWPVAGGRMPYGFFIYAHEEPDDEIPNDVWACCVKARELGCEYILFDCDAAILADLPTYDD
ncbi:MULTISPECIES: hypothetical protein [unclassified Xanthobacter]|uniref:DUF5983 family protein n=1 Tax=unclassified Xanthobacter TaxID=2623496 RepID=UPI001F2CE518|nr:MULTISPECIES: hypothetical protein [unclassified Xanthobacter]